VTLLFFDLGFHGATLLS